MKYYILAPILLMIVNLCNACGSDKEPTFDGITTIEASKNNTLNISMELISNKRYLVKFPKHFNGGSFTGSHLLISNNPDGEPYVAVSISPYQEGELIGIMIRLGNEVVKDSKVLINYGKKGYLCFSGAITIIGFDKLEYSQNWRKEDKEIFFARLKELEKGMTVDTVRKTIGELRYESSNFPKTLSDTIDGFSFDYYLYKDSKDTNLNQIVKIHFNNSYELIQLKGINVDLSLIPNRLLIE